MSVTFHGKNDFAGAIKLRMLKWGDYPGLSGWAGCNHRGLYKGKKAADVSGSELGRGLQMLHGWP